jgi:hypothetical protein
MQALFLEVIYVKFSRETLHILLSEKCEHPINGDLSQTKRENLIRE